MEYQQTIQSTYIYSNHWHWSVVTRCLPRRRRRHQTQSGDSDHWRSLLLALLLPPCLPTPLAPLHSTNQAILYDLVFYLLPSLIYVFGYFLENKKKTKNFIEKKIYLFRDLRLIFFKKEKNIIIKSFY